MGNPPTMLADLSPERRRLLELLRRQQEQQGRGPIRALPRTSGRTTFPLSFAQQRLWFIDQFQPDNIFYHLLSAFRLSGPLNRDALEHALNAIIQRHEPLRTTFSVEDGQPVQVIAPTFALALPITDLSADTTQAHEAAIQRSIVEDARLPFDLQRGPLLRVRLLRLSLTDHVLIITSHHIIVDGWSLGVLVRELITLYQAYATGREPSLPPLPIQYADFSEWQRSVLQGQTLADQLGYWKQQLADLSKLQLPTDYPRTATTTLTGARALHLMPRSLSEALKALSQHEGATLFMTLLAAFQVLLHRYTSQTDIAVGSGIAGRNRAEIEPLIGFFVNTLVLRARLNGNPSFRETLRQVRETTLAAYAHQDLPFEKLVEELQPERDLGQAPFFQVSFVLQNTPLPALTLPALRIEPIDTEHVTPKLDLSVSIVELPEGLRARVQYNTELFAEQTITRMLEHFQQLLESIVADPDQRIGVLPLLSPAEEQAMLIDWNATAAPYPAEAGFHELFAAQVARTPDATALVFGETHMSYAELDRRANQLAHALQSLGVGPETRVGLAVARSPELIVGMLGVLKAGGCYVPLDPNYPAERLRFMLQDAQVSVLLTQAHLAATLPAHSARLLSLDSDWPWISRHSDRAPQCRALPDNAAYMIYTSGSTGQPKGVLVSHRGVGNLALVLKAHIGISAASRVLQFASFSFDGAVAEVVETLLNGATLVLAPAEAVQPGPDLGRLLAEQRITTLTLPPSALAVLTPAELAGVEQILVAGEACPPELAARWSAGRRFFNAYGPTETTVCLTLRQLDGTERVPPLGRPVANTRLYVLSAHGLPVPVGVAGEICAGSIGLARGYHGRPDLTAERFIPDPFSETPGGRLYRTGDLGRWLPDGTLEYLGRIDQQVKLRGFRIELGEIEAVLGQHPQVREHVVLAREDTPGNLRLVAYIVGNKGTKEQENKEGEPDGSRSPGGHPVLGSPLRAFLAQRLPDYMVPSAFVFLDALPLTPNGKVDRQALPAPDSARPLLDATLVLPRTPTEELIASVWSAVLGIRTIGVHDNFFALGGHSLLATQVITRLRQLLEQDLPLRALFEAPTIAAFAARLHADRADNLVPLRAVSRDGRRLPLSFAQQRLWFLDQLQPGSTLYAIPVVARLTGTLDRRALEHSLSTIVARHEVLRTTFVSDPNDETPEPWQQIAPPRPVALPLLVLEDSAADEIVRDVVQRLIRQPVDLRQGPLFRATLVQRSTTEHLLVVSIHHSIFDGWSQSVLIRELSALYRGAVRDEPMVLRELPIQYADYALWQRQWLAQATPGATLEQQLSYWRQQLQDVAPLDLPLDYPRPATPTEQGAQAVFLISATLTAELQRLSRQLNSTLFMTLLAAWQTLLFRYSGQTDIVVGTPIAGRVQPELEALIGFFVNTLVLRTDLAGQPSFAELVERVRTTALGAYAHQDVPFELVVEHVQPARDLSRSPLFQVMFILQNTPREPIDLPGLVLEPLTVEQHTAKFELTLTLSETDDGLRGQLSYRTDLFAAATIERLIQHYQTLLDAIVRDPRQRLGELPLLSEAERQTLLVDLNATTQLYPRERCVHDLIAAQAARTPDTIAVTFGESALTYGALDRRANQLAHELRALGVGPETRVGVCLQRSLDLVVALLGVLKAGGAYVPLDPTYPAERIQYVLDDSDAAVLLTETALLPSLAAYAGVTLCLDRDAASIARQPVTAPLTRVAPANLAYVLYTSGSTGRPKGVSIPHQALANFLHAMQQEPGLRANDVLLAVTTIAFDIAGLELWLPLTVGARIVLADRDTASDGTRLDALLASSGATVLQATPATWRLLLAAGWTGTPGLRALCGGEALPWDLAQTLLPRVDQLWNLYGPTETTIWSAATLVRVEDNGISLGRPIANTQLYVLNGQQRPVPLGVPGELYIGGDGLARGYLKRPDLTATQFVPDPFAAAPGARLYRTGDRVRYRFDGTLEFLGRVDQQVKLRGFRIELGEIETLLRQHLGVRDAAVAVRDDRLVAYVVGEPRNKETKEQTKNKEQTNKEQENDELCTDSCSLFSVLCSADLREYVGTRLPDYMIPTAWVVLDALPLTPNGKVDRQALPAPEHDHDESQPGFVAPRTPTEDLIASVWAGVLVRERIGIHDNFFALGGHSLLATQVVSRLRQALGREVPLRALFEAPTIAGLAAKLLLESAEAALPLLAVPRGDRRLPLSFAQQRLWLLDQLQPGSSLYAMPFAVRLLGSLDHEALARSLARVIDRHEVLRTTFAYEPTADAPWQVIAPVNPEAAQVALPLARLEAGTDDEALRGLVQAIASQLFDLQQGPLLRAALFQRTPTEHVLVLVLHHAIFDGWSQSILVQELCAFYRREVGDDAPSELTRLPSLPLQYADYAVWQRDWLSGAVLEQQLGYWRQQLGGLTPLALPTDRPCPPQPSNQGAHLAFSIPPEQAIELEQLSRRLGSTLFMTCLAAFKLLLQRYSGQQDVAVGTPIAGRVRPELENLIGFFVNTLVLRTDLAGRPTFADLIERVRATCLAAYAHQDIPFEMLVDELEPERDLSRSPLFQVMFVLQNTPRSAIELPGLSVEPLGVENPTARFDLTLTLSETAHGLQGLIEYRADLFDAATIERMASQYRLVLAAAVADPGRRNTELPLLTEAERQTLLSVWNATTAAYPQDAGLHQLIEAQAARTPDAIAVVYGQQQLTYAELNARANQLAHELRRRGVRPDTLVGVCVEPALELVVGLLGILKAGGCYVPLDPSYPAERLAFMVGDSQIRIILTQRHLRQRVASLVASTICLDQDWPQLAQHPIANPQTIVAGAQLAYMIYTSGSTGTPKGVLVTHRSIVNNIWWRQQTWPLTADDRVLQDFSISFDPSVSAICWPLIAGARVVLVGLDDHADSAALARLLSEHAITAYGGPPTIHAALLQEPALDACRSLRFVYSGGEQLPVDLQRRFLDRLDATLCNMYGPTEATIDATFWICRPDAAAHIVPIGRPLANVQIYLLDAQLQPVPVGVPGELYIGGDALARGYHGRPDLTAERFIPHPFADLHPGQAGARLYRTGDLARYRADGAIEFVGRIDDQVKLRGARIELGEIAAVLKQHPAVHNAAAIVHTEPSGNQWLVAYVEGEQKNKETREQMDTATPPSPVATEAEASRGSGKGGWGDEGLASQLRAFMEERLPKYMLPSAFVQLDALPLTPSGKVDRQALPPFDIEQLHAGRSYTAPRDVLEVQLVRIWEAVLQQQPIGVTDPFFERGGNSLLAVRLSAQIEQQLGQKLPVAMIFAHPTIRELATVLWERGWPGVLRKVDDLPPVKSPLVAIQPHGTRPPFFFVAPLGGVLPSNILSGLLDIMPYFGSDQPYYGVQLPGLAHELVPYLDGEHLLDPLHLQSLASQFSPEDQRIEQAAAQCIAAIRAIQPAGPYLIGGFCTGTTIAFEMACRLQRQGEAVGLLALVDPPLSLRPQPTVAPERRAEIKQRDIARLVAQLNHPSPEQVAWFINRDLGGNRLATDLAAMTARLHQLDRDDWWRYGAEQLAQIDGVMQGVDRQELRRLFMIYQLNTLSLNYVLRHYDPPVYPGRMVVVRAEQMYEHPDAIADHWQQLTTQPVEIRVVPGDHGTIFHEPNVQVLMQILLDYIARAGNADDR